MYFQQWKQPIGWLNIPYSLMPCIFASWQLGIFSCTKITPLLNLIDVRIPEPKKESFEY